MANTTKEKIKGIFERFKVNSVGRLKKLKDHAFVNFIEFDDTLHAMNLVNDIRREIDDSIVEVTLTKWVDKNQYFRFPRSVSLLSIAANLPFVLPTTISYLIILPTSLTTNSTSISTIPASVISGATVVSVTTLSLFTNIYLSLIIEDFRSSPIKLSPMIGEVPKGVLSKVEWVFVKDERPVCENLIGEEQLAKLHGKY
ncbi:unnamed protein product [Rotaria magnacalcarata]|uniref:RRM domain-containing protein n=1 Tax=Rotaria magnacalcarata TaxID=392030 RepID=A0A820G3G5_9BILA|nr:unnamed protein product [Rotaria magnacalcarata]CAF4271821.1 unnamed protein product [Rotaria magnacalcarata]